MERKYLIAFYIGRFAGKYPKDPDPKHLQIYIDQCLISANLPPLTVEDTEFLQECIDETSFSVLSAGINREQRRRT